MSSCLGIEMDLLSQYRVTRAMHSSRCSVTNSMPAGAYHLLAVAAGVRVAVAVDILMALSLRYIDK